MAGTFATQFVSGRPEVDRRTQGREEDPVKRRIACKRGLQRKEKIRNNVVFSFGCAFSESRMERAENSV